MSLDEYFRSLTRWQDELNELRRIILKCGLTETRKWRQPCYMDESRNVLILGSMKRHCVVSFLKGVFLDDRQGVLVQPGEQSRSVRYFPFTSLQEIQEGEELLCRLIKEAVEIERSGQKVEQLSQEESLSLELQQALNSDGEFCRAFMALTPGRRRAYQIHFAQAKQEVTRIKRIAQYRSRILDGKGLNDCVCGLTKNPPRCDGSHRTLYPK